MKNLCAALILIFDFCAVSFAQTNQSVPCPEISVTRPATVISPGEPITFTANITSDNSLKYEWTITAGTIVEGQNSSAIKVATTPEMTNSDVTATVKIEGLPDTCVKTAFETASIVGCQLPITWDDYGKIPFKEERERLAAVAANLVNQPETSALFIIHFPEKENPQAIKKYIEKISNVLTQVHKVPKERISFLIGETETQRTTILIIPTEVIKRNPELAKQYL